MSEVRSQPWVLYALIAANVAMFGIELATGASPIRPGPQHIIDLGGSYPPLTLHGEWWRLGSSMFLHFGLVHLAMNMLCLYQVRPVELVFGRVGFLVIYLCAGLGGGIASLIANSGDVVVAGASGAVFGVYGAFGAKLVLHRAQFDPGAWEQITRRLATFLVLNAVIGFTMPGISMSAHVGGFIVGVAFGAALLVGSGAEAARTRRALGLAVLGVALTAVAVMSIKPEPDVNPVLRHFDSVEHTAMAAREHYEAGEIKAAEFVAIVERDVIAPLRQVRDEMRATPEVPQRLRATFARIDEVITARLGAWDAFKALIAEQDPDKRAALREAYKRKEAEVAERLEVLNTELKSRKK